VKITIFYLFWIFLLAQGLHAQNLNSVVARDDNDIVTFRDSVSGKETMPSALKTNIAGLIAKVCKELSDDCDMSGLYFQTFKIIRDDGYVLYVTELNESLSGFQIYLCIYDSKKNNYSDFLQIDGTFMYNNEQGFESWNGRMIDKPYITFADLDGDSKNEILFQRRAHNGTWNAVETIAIKTDEVGNLKKYFSFYSKELKETGTETMEIRKIKSVKNGKVALGVTERDMTFHIDNEAPDEIITITK
jgi:hypothetical protein